MLKNKKTITVIFFVKKKKKKKEIKKIQSNIYCINGIYL